MLTDEQLRILLAHDPSNKALLKQLAWRTSQAAWRKLPSPEGTCGCGRRVRLDDKGAMSTGYWYHVEPPYTTCLSGHKSVRQDPNTPDRERILGIIRFCRQFT